MSRLPLLLLVFLLWLDSPNHNYSRAALTATLAHARTQLLFSRPFACSAASLRDLSHSFINMLSNPLSPGSTLSFPGPLKNPRKGFRRDATLGEEEEKKFRLKKQRSLLCVFFFSSQNGLSSTHAHTLEHRVNGSGKTAARSSPSLHPWHPPHLFPPTYSSSLPPSLSLSTLACSLCQTKCKHPLYLSAHYFQTFSTDAHTFCEKKYQLQVLRAQPFHTKAAFQVVCCSGKRQKRQWKPNKHQMVWLMNNANEAFSIGLPLQSFNRHFFTLILHSSLSFFAACSLSSGSAGVFDRAILPNITSRTFPE